MAKQETSRPEQAQPRNGETAVPALLGKVRHSGKHVRPVIAGTAAPETKMYRAKPHGDEASLYSGYDTDLAADNLSNDLPDADNRDN